MPNKAQFVELLAARLDGDKRRAQVALDAVIDTVYASVARGERVVLTGFGTFERRERAARTARNPATGASVKVRKKNVPAFKPGAEFKDITSGAKKVAKAPAKKVTVKSATRPATKTAAKKTAARKTVAKKTVARKTAAKKAPAKKVAKKTAARKTAAKRAR